LDKPPITQYLNTNEYYYSYGTNSSWRKLFFQKGYEPVNQYLTYHNGLWPYLNLLYQYKIVNIFASSSFNLENHDKLQQLLNANLNSSANNSDNQHLLQDYLFLLGVEKIISTEPLKQLSFPLAKKINHYYLYQNPQPLPSIWINNRTESYLNASSLINIVNAGLFNNQVLYLKNYFSNQTSNRRLETKISITPQGYRVYSSTKAFFVYRQTNYPGWQATVNDRPSPIYEANLFYLAVPINQGWSDIRFSYSPPHFWLCLTASLIGLTIAGWLIFDRRLAKSWPMTNVHSFR
jgi:hypothetical protein